MKSTVLIWGTGERTQNFVERGYFKSCDIVGFVETYRKNRDQFMECPIYCPNELIEKICCVDYLIIVNQYFEEILELCMELGIAWNKIILTDNVKAPLFNKMFLRLRTVSEELFHILENGQMYLVKTNESDQKDINRLLGRGKYNAPMYMQDYFRYRTFEFVANEIIENDVEGEVAELGVFRGVFSSMLNELFRNKKLYLFDTFEGFESGEAVQEVQKGRCDEDFVSVHKNTSVERMLVNLPYPEQCVICKGLFPGTVTEEIVNEKFSFVSIDVDFEESTYQGLKFFYPRMSDGGIIFIHDYNTFFLDGVRNAVKRFEREEGAKLKSVPLADRAGTLVIIK